MFQRPVFLDNPLKNQWYALRHGQSSANVAGLIISDPAIGTKDYGLTKAGRRQVTESLSQQTMLDSRTLIYSSDFLRTVHTATIASSEIGTSTEIVHTALLRERNFGDWEASASDNYQKVWQHDYLDASHTHEQVESVHSVAARATSLIETLEANYSGEVFLLVSHGDTLQILECVFRDLPLTHHRDLTPLETAEIRRLG